MGVRTAGERIDPRRLFLAVAAGGLVATIVVSGLIYHSAIIGIDANTHLAAGERLNDGRAVYHLLPGDRAVHDENGVPLLSPPFIAVLWRPLAWLRSWTAVAWTLLSGLAIVDVIFFGWIDHPRLTSAAVIVLTLPLLIHVPVGNVNGFLMAGTVLAVKRPRLAPVLIGLMAAIKLWPLLLAIALIRRPRQVGELAAVLVGCAVVSLLGAGWDAHVEYLAVVGGFAPNAWSFLGMAGPLVTAAAVLGTLVFAARGSARSAVVASVIANPALHYGAWTTLLPAMPTLQFAAMSGTSDTVT